MRFVFPVLMILSGAAAVMADEKAGKDGITKASFGKLEDGTPIDIYTLCNEHGLVAKITNFGGLVTELHVPDKNGKMADVVLGFDNLKDYLGKHPYFGATVGRVANRIAGAAFMLDNKEYKLFANAGKNTLHGGEKGLDKVVWKATPGKEGAVLHLEYTSPDGEEGYPGTLKIKETYTLTPKNELKIELTATTDKTTPVNLAHHSYFNLAGHDSGTILDTLLMINADEYTPTDDDLIVTGKIALVKGTPFDFTEPTAIGKRIKELKSTPQGYDLNYVLLRDKSKEGLQLAARVMDPKTGRVMELWTTEPGLQFYTGNFLDGTNIGKGGVKYQQYGAICLEAQHFPDSVHHPEFPSTILQPGKTYSQTTSYAFSAK